MKSIPTPTQLTFEMSERMVLERDWLDGAVVVTCANGETTLTLAVVLRELLAAARMPAGASEPTPPDFDLPEFVKREAIDWWAEKIEENPKARPLRERLNDFLGNILTEVRKQLAAGAAASRSEPGPANVSQHLIDAHKAIVENRWGDAQGHVANAYYSLGYGDIAPTAPAPASPISSADAPLPYATRKCRGHWHVTVCGEDLIGEYDSQEAAQAVADRYNAEPVAPAPDAPSDDEIRELKDWMAENGRSVSSALARQIILRARSTGEAKP